MKLDLDSLYSELDLRPNCSLEEFQRAYRRRIGALHPDRPRVGLPTAETQAQLQDLIWLHAAVTRFHRRYGRMPGCRGHPSHAGSTNSRAVASASPSDEDGGERRSRSKLTLMAMFIALLILMACWQWVITGSWASV